MNQQLFFKRVAITGCLLMFVVVLGACQNKKEKKEETKPEKTIETTIETKSNAATIIVEDSSN